MESNKDEAMRCLQLTRRAIEAQDFSKALRMAERAQRMFPTSEGAVYVKICQGKLDSTSSSSPPSSNFSSSSQGGFTRQSTASSSSSPSPSSNSSSAFRKSTSPTSRTRSNSSNSSSSSSSTPSSSPPSASSATSSFASSARRIHSTSTAGTTEGLGTASGTGTGKKAQGASQAASSSSPFSSPTASHSAAGRKTDLPRSKSTPVGGGAARTDKKDGDGGDYTAEQVALCTRILTTTCYYETLGVEKTATDDTLKKAYKKLALQLHPDKNKAPHAEEAFKKVSKVFQCLNDPEKRRRYDLHGTEDSSSETTRVRYRHGGGLDGEGITPEELFQAFFGFNMGDLRRRSGQTRFYYQQGRTPRAGHNGENGENANFYHLLQVLPMALMFLIMFMGNLLPSSPPQPPAPYSFYQTTDFPIPRLTRYHSVRFYVDRSFHHNYPDSSESLRELEMTIELKFYHGKCQKEKEDLSRQLNIAHYYRASDAKVQEILDRPRPNCQIYDTLWSQRGGRKG
ncbi:hypothetical protein CSUI_001529 [Cystoisospora suis]|uniref:J domain-containing protein n=1 Tax=Cystoisospora suis TaxID=483139 RepID=A0A2C6LCD9_9APIC|nr:hypothetical protein CSUI_001529 [Cystoisospora suis]